MQVRWDTGAGLSDPPIPFQCKGRCSRLSHTLNFLPLSSGELSISGKRFQVLLLGPLHSHCKIWRSWLRDVTPVSVPSLQAPHPLSSGRAVLYLEEYLRPQKMQATVFIFTVQILCVLWHGSSSIKSEEYHSLVLEKMYSKYYGCLNWTVETMEYFSCEIFVCATFTHKIYSYNVTCTRDVRISLSIVG